MAELTTVLLLTLGAGLAIPAGGLLAHLEHLREGHIRADMLLGIMAFGGGALMSAVVLVLVPDGLEKGSGAVVIPAFAGGAVAALLLSRWLDHIGTKASQSAAMILDFGPESLALGAAAATGNEAAFVLALLIGMQNLPEGFGAYRELCDHHDAQWGRRVGLGILAAMALLGPAAGALGYLVLPGRPGIEAVVLLAASGAILALVFQDIAPAAHRKHHVVPAMGMVLGFSLGLGANVLL